MATDDWVTIGAPQEQAPAAADDWVTIGAPAKTGAPAAAPAGGSSSILDFFKGLGGGAVRGLAQFSQDVGRGNSPELGGTGTSIPEVAPVAANTAKALGVAPTGEGYGNAIGETLVNPFSYIGPGGMLAKAGLGAISAAGSEAGGQLGKGTPFEPVLRLAGAIGAGSLPGALSGLTRGAVIAPERQALLDTLKKEGVDLTAGQYTGSKKRQYAESILADTPFSGKSADTFNDKQASQFTRAALSRAGINADRATPEVMDQAHRDIGGAIETAGARNTFQPDAQLGQDVVGIGEDYHNLSSDATRAPVVKKYVDDILNGFSQGDGTMPGTKYQQLRSDIARDARGASGDPKTKFALQDITHALDAAMERSIQATNPADAGAFGAARKNYRNLLVLDRAAGAGGENAAEGAISPAQLASAVKSLQGKTNYVRGLGDFADLARAGAVMTPLPNSGTSQRMNILHHLQLAGLLGAEGGAAGHFSGGNMSSVMLGAAGGLVTPALTARAMLSKPGQYYMKYGVPGLNQLPQIPGLLNAAPGAAASAVLRPY